MITDDIFKRDLVKEVLEIYQKGNDDLKDDLEIEIEINRWFKTHNEPPSQIFEIILERSNDGTNYKTLLAFMYGFGMGTEIDEREMFRYYLIAAEQGDPVAANQTGWCFYDGVGTRKDPENAFRWFQRSANGGDAIGMNWLAHCYEKGVGVEADVNKAFNFYLTSAYGGEPKSQYDVGRCYRNGLGVSQDYSKAVYCPDAANELGYLYEQGIGTRPDRYKSLLCYRKSAVGSDHIRKFNYANSIHDGFGGSVDKHQAIYWYRRALAYGDTEYSKVQLNRIFLNNFHT
ncbi:1871_t:CDS:2 [Ambispora leptoticha]|uniref:1871_t:CDS:1 n=1 Tax=Ambispora leptoticha TaxID=144679 RepID=A0A9N9C4N8_9GLOM|nr:1871_t:CDS:2 [Ambispora leptoticha]